MAANGDIESYKHNKSAVNKKKDSFTQQYAVVTMMAKLHVTNNKRTSFDMKEDPTQTHGNFLSMT